MNFPEAFKQGQTGQNKGLTTGLEAIDRAIDGIQRKSIYGICAAPKVGKTTISDYCFVLQPYINDVCKLKRNVKWIYLSYEIDRIKKEFKFASFFMVHDYGIYTFVHEGKKYNMSPRYLLGRLTDKDDKVIPVSEAHIEKLKIIYKERIIPMFGEYDEKGNKISDGVIEFIEERSNPTGIRNYILNYAEKHGKFINESYQTKEDGNVVTKYRISGYVPDDPEEYVIIVTDHKINVALKSNLY